MRPRMYGSTESQAFRTRTCSASGGGRLVLTRATSSSANPPSGRRVRCHSRFSNVESVIGRTTHTGVRVMPADGCDMWLLGSGGCLCTGTHLERGFSDFCHTRSDVESPLLQIG